MTVNKNKPLDLLHEVEQLVRKGLPSGEVVFGGTRVVVTYFGHSADDLFPMPGGRVDVRFTLTSLGPVDDAQQERLVS